MIRFIYPCLTLAGIFAVATSEAQACPVRTPYVAPAVAYAPFVQKIRAFELSVYNPLLIAVPYPVYGASAPLYQPAVAPVAAPAALPCTPMIEAMQRRLDALEGKRSAANSTAPMLPAGGEALTAPGGDAFGKTCLVCHRTGGEAKPALDVALTDAVRLKAIQKVLKGEMPPPKSKVPAPDADAAGAILETLTGVVAK